MSSNLSLLRLCLKKNASINRALFLAISFSVMIAIFISAFFSSMQKTEENRRAQLYGSWHFAVYNADEQAQNRLAHHAIIQRYGKMKLYGLVKQGEAEIGNFGIADFNTKVIGNLSLSMGSYPKAGQEIAAERNALEALGYTDPQIGQSVTLTIQYQMDEEVYTLNHTFRLSGVLDNYSNLWKGPENSRLSFIIGDISEKYTPVSINAFCDVKQDYLASVDELLSIAGDEGVGVINDYTYLNIPQDKPHSANNNTEISSSLLHLILLSITAFVVFILLMDLLQQKGDDAELMRNIGATEDQLINTYAKVFCIIAFAALVIGMLFGTLAAWAVYSLFPKLFHMDFIFCLPAEKVLLDFLLLSSTVAVAFLLSTLSISGKSFQESKFDDKFKAKNRKKTNFTKPMTIIRMQHIFNRAHRKEVVYTLTIVCCTCIALSGITFFAYEKYLDCLALQDTYPMDYEFSCKDFNKEGTQSLNHIPESDLLKIKNSYGVEKVQAYKYKEDIPYRWNGMNFANKLIMPNQAGDQGECSFLGVSNNYSDLNFLADYLSFSAAKSFQEGQSVILYVPERHTADIMAFSKNILSFPLPDSEEPQNQIYKVKAGDVLVLNGPLGDCQVKISGIIHTNLSDRFPQLSGQPNAMIGSYNLAGRLYETSDNKSMELVHVFGNAASNLNRLDEEMENLSGDMYYRNLRIEKSDAAVQSYFCLLIVALIDLAILLSSLVVWRGGAAFPLHTEREKIRCLYFLGMKKSRLLLLQIFNTLIFTLIGGCLAYVIILIINSLKYVLLNYRVLDDNINWIILLKEGMSRFFSILPIGVYGALFCLFLFLNLLVTVMPFFREIHFFTKNNK